MRSAPDNADLEALVRAAQAGDKDALAQLLQSGLYIIHAAVEGRVREHDVEDVLQEVRLGVWEALPSLKEPAAVRIWLRKITTGTIADHYRNGDGAVHTRLIQDDLQEADTAFEEVESWQAVREVLAGLSERQRAALILHGAAELPFSEVGRLLGVSEPAARSLFRKGKIKILAIGAAFDPKIPT